MKKIYLLLLTLLGVLQFAYAQTSTFPTSGNAGIGTTSPSQQLTINQLPGSAKGCF